MSIFSVCFAWEIFVIKTMCLTNVHTPTNTNYTKNNYITTPKPIQKQKKEYSHNIIHHQRPKVEREPIQTI